MAERLETENAALIIEQKIREAEHAHGGAKRALAALIVKIGSEEKALAILDNRISDLTDRTRKALQDDKEELAQDGAAVIAQLENEREVRQNTLATSRTKAERMRLAIERTHRQLIELRQGLITAQSLEKERRALSGSYSQSASARSAIREGEAVLSRLLNSEDPIALDETLDQIDADLSGDTITQRLSDAGYGAPLKTRAEDVLERLRTSTKPKKTPKTA